MTSLCPRCSAPRPTYGAVCQWCGYAFGNEAGPVTPPGDTNQPQAHPPAGGQAQADQSTPPSIPPQPWADWGQPAQPAAWTQPGQPAAWTQPGQPVAWGQQPVAPPPAVCPNCSALLPPGSPTCGNCGYVWTPPGPVAAPRRGFSRVLGLLIAGIVVAAGVAAFVVVSQPKIDQTEADAIVAVLQANADAMNNGDLDAYMDCLDPSSPLYASTRAYLQTVFATYKVHVDLSDVRIQDVSGNVAHVHVVITNTKISGPAFRDNRITALMEMHRVNGAWKIYGQTISDIEYL
jgi:ketosteroid isomerase-like protein/ribosomal protein L40E